MCGKWRAECPMEGGRKSATAKKLVGLPMRCSRLRRAADDVPHLPQPTPLPLARPAQLAAQPCSAPLTCGGVRWMEKRPVRRSSMPDTRACT